MKKKLINPHIIRLLLVGLIPIVILACSSTGSRTKGQKSSDKEISKEVSKRLEDDPVFKFPDVHATAYDGSVQLSGFVEYPEQRLRAAQTASHVKGTKQVINDIMIKPTPTGPATIRDPLGNTSKILVDTNSLPPQLYNWTNSARPEPTRPEPTNPTNPNNP